MMRALNHAPITIYQIPPNASFSLFFPGILKKHVLLFWLRIVLQSMICMFAVKLRQIDFRIVYHCTRVAEHTARNASLDCPN